jgi:hypothetical protein
MADSDYISYVMTETSLTVKNVYNGGLFSTSSVILFGLIGYYKRYSKTPSVIDTITMFYKYNPFEYYHYLFSSHSIINNFYNFNTNDVSIDNLNNIIFDFEAQYEVYNNLDFKNITPFIQKYFTPSKQIINYIDVIEQEYNIDYDNTCVLFFRGNDKITETPNMCSHEDIIDKAKQILETNPNITFLIQSDETEFIQKCKSTFINNICFDKYCRHIHTNRKLTIQNITNDKMDVFKYGQYFLSISYIMSKCKYIICPTGNCSLWIILFRGNCDGIYQNKDRVWY